MHEIQAWLADVAGTICPPPCVDAPYCYSAEPGATRLSVGGAAGADVMATPDHLMVYVLVGTAVAAGLLASAVAVRAACAQKAPAVAQGAVVQAEPLAAPAFPASSAGIVAEVRQQRAHKAEKRSGRRRRLSERRRAVK